MKQSLLAQPGRSSFLHGVLRSLLALLLVGSAITLSPSPASAMGSGYWDPVSLNNPAAGWLAHGCGGPHGYESGLYHIGRDYWASVNDDVKAIDDGVVHMVAGFGAGFAQAMFVKHKAGDGSEFIALYGHVTTWKSPGDTVHAGDHIADIASITGGSHLHFGIYPSWNGMPNSGWGRMSCVNNQVGSTNGFVDPVPYLNQHPFDPPVVDSDGDGFSDGADQCPGTWGKRNGCPLHSDFSNDGRAEIASFYRYDGNLTNLALWNGMPGQSTSLPYATWSGSGWDGSRLRPAGNGNFNGDRFQDTAAFFMHDDGMIDLNIWFGNESGSLNPGISWHANDGWEAARLNPAGAADFNGDGRTDIAAFYHYEGNQTSLYIWFGQANGDMHGPYTAWQGNGWDGTRIVTVGAGDVDGDGNKDIATFYRHDAGMVDYNVWYNTGSGNAATMFNLERPWHRSSGWDVSRFIPGGLADLNGDNRAEAIVFYRHNGNYVDMRTWPGTASRVISGEPGGPWSGSGWDGSRIIPAGTGDFNGDGTADLATFYRHDGQALDMNVWYGNGTGALTLYRPWTTSTGWEGARLIPAARG